MNNILQCNKNDNLAYSDIVFFDRRIVPVMRIVRATSNLKQTVEMYKTGLNYKILYEFKNHDGFDGVMLGHENWPYHLEFTNYQRDDSINGEHYTPNPEDALVFYCKGIKAWSEQCERMNLAGFKLVIAQNPYWNKNGEVFQDKEGHNIILANQEWTI